MIKVITSEKIPIKLWLEDIDEGALQQAKNLANLPFAFKHISIMPDSHQGYGMPIGGVLATNKVIIPNAVGVDIGCFTGDTKISLLDGTEKTFKEQLNKKFWIYSISDNNIIIPGYAECIKTKENSQLVEVELDNGEKIKCTPEQLFKMRNGEYKEAKDLNPDDSLMPFNRTYQLRDGYEILHNPDNRYTLTHKMVSEYIYGLIPKNFVRHHINKNKLDNRPENIEIIYKNKHNSLHGKDHIERLKSDRFKEQRIMKLKENGFYDPKYYEKKKEIGIINIINYMKNNPDKYKEDIKDNGKRGREYLISYNKSEKGRLKSREISNRLYKCDICGQLIKSPIGLYNHKRKYHNNHKVVNIKFLKEKEDVYCLRVNNEFNNFALTAGIFVHNCGMCARSINISQIDLSILQEIRERIKKTIPVGKNWYDKPLYKFFMPKRQSKEYMPIVWQQYEKAGYQIGTLGGGNHFIEIQKGNNNKIWIMIHSGSRNLGKKVADHYNKLAIYLNEKWYTQVPKEYQLAFLPIDSLEGKQYRNEMEYCREFALESRSIMMKIVSDIFFKVFPDISFGPELDVSHNYAVMENHFGRNVMVHRKGATQAREGQVGIIPGSQGSKSYIVKGKGNKESFQSCSHGAGRKLGRRQARRELNLEEQKRIMDKQGIIHSVNSINNLDEAPGAYKNIDTVMNNQLDLVYTAVELSPLAVIKEDED